MFLVSYKSSWYLVINLAVVTVAFTALLTFLIAVGIPQLPLNHPLMNNPVIIGTVWLLARIELPGSLVCGRVFNVQCLNGLERQRL